MDQTITIIGQYDYVLIFSFKFDAVYGNVMTIQSAVQLCRAQDKMTNKNISTIVLSHSTIQFCLQTITYVVLIIC